MYLWWLKSTLWDTADTNTSEKHFSIIPLMSQKTCVDIEKYILCVNSEHAQVPGHTETHALALCSPPDQMSNDFIIIFLPQGHWRLETDPMIFKGINCTLTSCCSSGPRLYYIHTMCEGKIDQFSEKWYWEQNRVFDVLKCHLFTLQTIRKTNLLCMWTKFLPVQLASGDEFEWKMLRVQNMSKDCHWWLNKLESRLPIGRKK